MIQIDNNRWEIFQNWDLKQEKYSWGVFDELEPNYIKVVNFKREKYLSLLKVWDTKLEYLGKDPSHVNWEEFRPLRLSREEDWSDWLAFLIQQSKTGFFAKNLFDIYLFNKENYASPVKVLREEWDYSNSYRADLIIQWANKKFSHFEVKVGNVNLLKTFEASQKFKKTFNVSKNNWTDFILLLPHQVSNWKNILKYNKTENIVVYKTWIDVSLALRKSLLVDESANWKVWAYSFIGAIEQKLLGLDNYWSLDNDLTLIDIKIEILEKALQNG